MPRPTPPSSPSVPKLEISPARRWPELDREKLKANLRLIAWVVPLTILIWIWAEREQVLYPNSPNMLNVPVIIKTKNSDTRSVELSTGQPQTVNLKLSGPQESIDRVRQALFEQQIPHGLTIDIGEAPVAEHEAVHIVDQIKDLELFKREGVSVEESQPADVFVDVDRIETRAIKFQVPPELAAHLDGLPVFTPDTVRVTGPSRAFRALETDGRALKAFADLTYDGELTVPGEHSLTKVPVRIPGGEKLTVGQNAVSVRLTIRSADETYTIKDGIPITVNAPISLTDAYKVVVSNDASIADISVTGPKQAIAAIKDKSFFVKATLEVTTDDVAKSENGKATLSRPLTFTLPEGVTPTDESKRKTVDFTITKRENGA